MIWRYTTMVQPETWHAAAAGSRWLKFRVCYYHAVAYAGTLKLCSASHTETAHCLASHSRACCCMLLLCCGLAGMCGSCCADGAAACAALACSAGSNMGRRCLQVSSSMHACMLNGLAGYILVTPAVYGRDDVDWKKQRQSAAPVSAMVCMRFALPW
jgi:hypothetical protein